MKSGLLWASETAIDYLRSMTTFVTKTSRTQNPLSTMGGMAVPNYGGGAYPLNSNFNVCTTLSLHSHHTYNPAIQVIARVGSQSETMQLWYVETEKLPEDGFNGIVRFVAEGNDFDASVHWDIRDVSPEEYRKTLALFATHLASELN